MKAKWFFPCISFIAFIPPYPLSTYTATEGIQVDIAFEKGIDVFGQRE